MKKVIVRGRKDSDVGELIFKNLMAIQEVYCAAYEEGKKAAKPKQDGQNATQTTRDIESI